MCAADPRYITHEDDCNRGDVVTPVSNVRRLISQKEKLDEAVATVWLTTAEMGFSLTDENHMVVCLKGIREGTTADGYLAPAISKFAITVQKEEEREPTLDRGESELQREIVNLPNWVKIREEDNDAWERARKIAVKTQGFTRTVRQKKKSREGIQ
jgi:hypothetical protein